MRWGGRQAIVTLPADIDMNNAFEAGDELLAVLQHAVLIVDTTGATFCASAGVHALLRAQNGPRRSPPCCGWAPATAPYRVAR